MRSRAALAGVSRSWYRFVFWDSIDPVLWFIAILADRFYVSVYAVRVGTVIVSHLTCKADTAEIPCCLAHHAHQAYLEQMELRHLRYFVAVAEEQNVTRGGQASRVTADIKPPNPRFGGSIWYRAF